MDCILNRSTVNAHSVHGKLLGYASAQQANTLNLCHGTFESIISAILEGVYPLSVVSHCPKQSAVSQRNGLVSTFYLIASVSSSNDIHFTDQTFQYHV